LPFFCLAASADNGRKREKRHMTDGEILAGIIGGLFYLVFTAIMEWK
jgi:hypothetical protein